MEAKDTVMNKGKQAGLIRKYGYQADAILAPSLEAQAEITYPIAFKAGIREVVKWVDGCTRTGDCFQEDGSVAYKAGDVVMTKALWQAKLKEWGIKDG